MNLEDLFFGDNSAIKSRGYTHDFAGFISSILPTFYILAGLILFIYLIFGGFMIISSSGDEKKTAEGAQALTNAIIGFVIVFASYWIIQIIQIITGLRILY